MPFSPLYLVLFIAALGMLMVLVQLGLVTMTFEKLGLSQDSAFMLLFLSLFGSAINLPLFSVRARPPSPEMQTVFYGLLRGPRPAWSGRTIVTVNVGGGLIPVLFSLYLFRNTPIDVTGTALATLIVAAVSHRLSRPLPGLGIAMPLFVAPLTAALAALLLGGEYRAPLAYICGSLGVLIGADLLRLRDIPSLGVPVASIGGAGTFDGIFLTGLVAVMLT
ncbi:MAG TPA: DUF1614 domain-containing protein [Gammaproteobacteria bacterium]|nr:DUF1614 domain-containing protein [Gammaproteobacteria bacterium]